MEQFKRVKVIMLPKLDTAENVPILKNINNRSNQRLYPTTKGYYYTQAYLKQEEFEAQHLYIISDDEIKANDYWINLDTNTIHTGNLWKLANNASSCKKIIATTDTSLKLSYDGTTSISKDWGGIQLPKPSEDFVTKYIEQYNKGNVIEYILVAYDNVCKNGHYMAEGNLTCLYPYCNERMNKVIRVQTKDNTITIKRIKDTWNREEIRLEFMYALSEFAAERGLTPTSKEMKEINEWSDKWITNNLK